MTSLYRTYILCSGSPLPLSFSLSLYIVRVFRVFLYIKPKIPNSAVLFFFRSNINLASKKKIRSPQTKYTTLVPLS